MNRASLQCQANMAPIRPEVRCHQCGQVIFDGLVIKSRVVRLLPIGAEAKCRCKAWVKMPVVYLSI